MRLDPVVLARRLLAACALSCVAGLGTALTLQHVGGYQPCVWCVAQRLIYVILAAVCALGAALPGGRRTRIAGVVLGGAFATLGLAAALYHQFVAARPGVCGVTIADKIMMALELHEHLPWMFSVTALCDEANAPLLGIPFAVWSAVLFSMNGVALAYALVSLRRRRRVLFR